jgi:hypothetical protein
VDDGFQRVEGVLQTTQVQRAHRHVVHRLCTTNKFYNSSKMLNKIVSLLGKVSR